VALILKECASAATKIRTAIRILITYLLEQAALDGHIEIQMKADSEHVVEPQTVQLRLEM
jgi:hypothetical protein